MIDYLDSNSAMLSTLDWQYEMISEMRKAMAERETSERSVLL